MNRDTERRKQQLITMGKAKGYVTYDEVNDHLPDEIVSSDQIDDWLSSLGDEGIEIVDAGAQVKLPAVAVVAPVKEIDVAEEEAEEEKETREEDDDYDGGYSKTN